MTQAAVDTSRHDDAALQVLVVDDDPEVLELLRVTLESDGYEVATVATARQAFEYLGVELQEWQAGGGSELEDPPPAEATVEGDGGEPELPAPPDLVLLDIHLPDATGIVICERLRAIPAYSDLPIVLISANAQEETRVRGLTAGADDFIAKPFYPRELLAKAYRCVQAATDRQRLEQQTTELVTMAEQARDDLTRTQRQLKKQVYSNQTIMSLCQQLASSLKLDELLHTFVLMVMGQLGTRSVAVFLPSVNAGAVLLPAVQKGVGAKQLDGICIAADDVLGKLLIERNRPVPIRNVLYRPGLRRSVERMHTEGFDVMCPVVIEERLSVVVVVTGRMHGRDYDSDELEIFDALCKTAGVAIQNAKLFQELHDTCFGIIRTLTSTLEAKDPYTRGHTDRVAMYSVTIAVQMGMTPDEVEEIRLGAILHDIGKLGIVDAVLKKPGVLDRDERQHIMSHPARGAAILEGLPFLSSAVDMVLHHHENLDGSGYPDGLAGEDISVGARIVAVADAFDAMTSGRAYMRRMSVVQAIDSLRSRVGKQYDNQVVDALQAVIQEGRVQLGI